MSFPGCHLSLAHPPYPHLFWLHTLHTAHSQSAHQVFTHTYTHTRIHPPRHSIAPSSTAGRLRLPVSASPKTYPGQSSSSMTLSVARLRLASCVVTPPPAEPTHWSVTTPGGRHAHSANSDRKWYDSFVSLNSWIFVTQVQVQVQPI